MNGQKSFILLCCSFLRGSSDIVTSICPNKAGQYCDFGLIPLHSPAIIQDARPDILDAPLMFISSMAQRVCRFLFT